VELTTSAQAFVIIAAAVLGLAVGSFLNVVIWRVPRGESVVKPASHCPRCETPLANRDNVPVVSWLLLRGRCRTCQEPISARYPAVELLTGVLWALLAGRFSTTEDTLAILPSALWLGGIGIALAAIDLDLHRLPNAITLPAYPVSFVLLAAATPAQHHGWRPIVDAVVGGAGSWLAFFALRIASGNKGMGFGDVKLAGVLGLHLGFLGWRVTVVGFFGAFLLGGLIGIAVLGSRRGGRKTRIPFGPFLVAGALIALLRGSEIAHAWLGSST
jgi:leader peptidase (prepilin peptidase)/N-methyltransferase